MPFFFNFLNTANNAIIPIIGIAISENSGMFAFGGRFYHDRLQNLFMSTQRIINNQNIHSIGEKMQKEAETQIYEKLSKIEREIELMKRLVQTPKTKKIVSLRGMARLLVSDEELEKAIGEAKKSLFNANSI